MTEPADAPFETSRLGRRLAARIAAEGPMPLDAFMQACLLDPEDGYYTTRQAIGAGGDFTTAPEISQIFGELIGLWAAQSWMDQGAPASATLAEVGPGRAQLMIDALRAGAALPPFKAAIRPMLIEASPKLQTEQQARLAAAGHPEGAIAWGETVADFPEDRPLWLIANELFDALPIRQWRFVDGAWRERVVACGPDGFVLTEAADGGATPPEAIVARFPDPQDGAFLETRPADAALIKLISDRILARGGAALFIDYGYDDAARESAGGKETLQALYQGQPCPPTARPGEADVTAHVNFDDLVAVLPPGMVAYGPLTQGAFLNRLGAETRATQLMLARPDQAQTVATGLRRLTHGAEMGQLFKALAIAPAQAPRPPGFEDAPARDAAQVRDRSRERAREATRDGVAQQPGGKPGQGSGHGSGQEPGGRRDD